MSEEPVNCADLRRRFVAGAIPSGPGLEAHLERCVPCRELLQGDARLGQGLGRAARRPEADVGELFTLLEGRIQRELGVRAWLRSLPTPVRASVFSMAAALLLASHLRWLPRPDLGVYSRVAFWSVAGLLMAICGLGALRLFRGPSAPLDSAKKERSLALALVAIPGSTALLAPLGSVKAAGLWGDPGGCFVYGALLSVPFLVLYLLFERRDRPPITALMAAGALSGVAANLLLHGHCPSAHTGHLLLGHVSVGAAWAMALGLLGWPARRVR